MATHYITWQDGWAHLDERVYSEPSIPRMTQKVEDAEARFDAELSRQFDLPFDKTDNPQAFALAAQVVALWAASDYIMSDLQVQGSETQLWYARHLRRQGDDLLKLFRVRHHPDDADAPGTPLKFIPQDVSALAGTERPSAFFKRNRATPGSSEHW